MLCSETSARCCFTREPEKVFQVLTLKTIHTRRTLISIMIRIEILELFYIWKLVNRIRRSIISTGTSATKQRRRFPYPRQIKRKPTQRYDRSYRIVIQMEKCLGPNKSLLLWFYQSDTGTSSLQRFSHLKLVWNSFLWFKIWFLQNENYDRRIHHIISFNIFMWRSHCEHRNFRDGENSEMDPSCGFDSKRWNRIVWIVIE